ncbi:hypothetical protein C0989_005020 [Termitomyces sp. Mn162]|nr:hypothetical protein C0989_005020 [Termitomyces sp. Mn162]
MFTYSRSSRRPALPSSLGPIFCRQYLGALVKDQYARAPSVKAAEYKEETLTRRPKEVAITATTGITGTIGITSGEIIKRISTIKVDFSAPRRDLLTLSDELVDSSSLPFTHVSDIEACPPNHTYAAVEKLQREVEEQWRSWALESQTKDGKEPVAPTSSIPRPAQLAQNTIEPALDIVGDVGAELDVLSFDNDAEFTMIDRDAEADNADPFIVIPREAGNNLLQQFSVKDEDDWLKVDA